MTKEIDNIADGLKTLEQYKDTPGHKAMVEIAYQNMNSQLARFMYGGDDEDLTQLRADFRAWMEIVASVDKRISEYSVMIKQVLEGTERQMQAMQGGHYGRQ